VLNVSITKFLLLYFLSSMLKYFNVGTFAIFFCQKLKTSCLYAALDYVDLWVMWVLGNLEHCTDILHVEIVSCIFLLSRCMFVFR
jgi:hypothetical protein